MFGINGSDASYMKKYIMHYSIGQFILLAAFMLGASFSTFAQVTVRGVIIDVVTRERLAGATVVLDEYPTGTATNVDGEFELTIHETLPFTLIISYIGYFSQDLVVDSPGQVINISLKPDAYFLEDVEITASRADSTVSSSQ